MACKGKPSGGHKIKFLFIFLVCCNSSFITASPEMIITDLTKIGFKKIAVGFLLILLIALLNAVLSSYIIQKNKVTITRLTNVVNPYVETLEQFNLLVTESKMYATNWVYLQRSENDKKNLSGLHEEGYPSLKQKLNGFLPHLRKQDDSDSLKVIFKKFEDLLQIEKGVMELLATFDDYENPKKKFSAEDIIESEVLPRTEEVMTGLKAIIKKNQEEARLMRNRMIDSFHRLITGVFIMSAVLFIVVLMASVFVSKSIKEPVLKMKDLVLKLGQGEVPPENLRVTEDLIGQMVSSVNVLRENFARTSLFAKEIGKENFTAEFAPLSEKDALGNALISMRDSLRLYSENMEQKVAERTREVMDKNAKLEMAYKEIRESIQYAKRIQEAILPASEQVFDVFSNSFIYYKPKDIVSGDFYWFAKKGDEALIAAVDCTGHGVPGALMTVIGNSLLNQIVNLGNVTAPAEILRQLDERVLATMRQRGTVDTNDGMDISLCRYNIKTKELTFAGANRSVYVFNGSWKEIKGNKFPIGSFQYEKEKQFSEHVIQVNKNDTVYLFSDGFQDQFGGDDGKKYMITRFRDLLTQIQPLPMKEQLAKLDDSITSWKGSYEQTDDILVMGFRF